MISDSEIRKLATLARLSVTQDELASYERDLNCILDYVKMLQNVDVKEIEPMSHVHGVSNVFREDEVEESLPLEQALSNAPEDHGRFFKTPLIIE